MSFVVCLILFALYWAMGKKSPGKNGKGDTPVHLIRETFFFLAMCSLVFVPLPFGFGTVGAVVSGLMSWLAGLIGSVVGVSATSVATGVLVVTVFIAAWDILSDLKVNKPAKKCLMAIPFLAMIAIGPVAQAMQGFTGNAHEMGTASISTFLGQ